MLVDLQTTARRLLADLDGRTPGRSLPDGEITMADAYALQAAVARLREERGEQVIGYKIGCTSAVIQEQLGIQEPIYGRLFDTGCLPSPATLSSADFANLAVEAELAIRLGSDVTASTLDGPAPWKVIESVFPVIELHHFVLRRQVGRGQELVATNGLHAGYVSEVEQNRCDQVDHLALIINDVRDETQTAWTMRSPIAALRWLAARLEESGLRLTRGQIVLAGSPLSLRPVAAGDRIAVEAPPFEVVRAEVIP